MSEKRHDQHEKDAALWQVVTADVTPLAPHRKAAAKTEKPAPAKKNSANTAADGQTPAAKTQKNLPDTMKQAAIQAAKQGAAPAQPGDFSVDRRTEQRFARGQMPIEAVLDLHGHTQDEAYAALKNFVLSARAQNMRCILVVTGKGRMGTGVLRQRVPDWLRDAVFAPFILRVRAARQNHGGDGALYILLRRNREPDTDPYPRRSMG